MKLQNIILVLVMMNFMILQGCGTTPEQPPSADSCSTALCNVIKGATGVLVFVPLLVTAPGEAGNTSALISDLINVGTNANIVKRSYERESYDTTPTYYVEEE